MPSTVTTNLAKPITSVKIANSNGAERIGKETPSAKQAANAEQILMQDLEAQKATFSEACQALKGVVAGLNHFYDKVFAEHKEKIAKLSVEIARKILVQKVQKGDYEIESIVEETLKNTPTHQDVVMHLNPEDLVQCQKAQQDNPGSTLTGIKFVADHNIGRAECVLDTPKGRIESFIDEHLERIGKALKKVE